MKLSKIGCELIRLSLICSLIASLVFNPIAVLAATFIDNSQATFNGTFASTAWNVANSGVQMTAGTSATYTSTIDNTTQTSRWNNFSWVPNAPYGKELPTNGQADSGYNTGNFSMSNNLAYWKFNETAGTTFADNSGNGANASCTTCPTTSTTARISNSRSFNGTTQFMQTSSTNSIKGSTSVSVNFWFRPVSVTGNRTIYDESTSLSTANSRFTLRTVGNKLNLEGRTVDSAASSTLWVQHPTTLVVNTWYHVVAVYNSTTNIHQIYLNNVVASSTVASATLPANNPIAVPQIGRKSNNTEFFSGQIDEFAIFNNRVISATEVNDLYIRGGTNLTFQIRTCNDAACTGETLVGPNGTTTTSFSELTSNSLTPPNFILNTTNAPINQYIQYRATFTRVLATYPTPLLKSVAIDYTGLQQSISFIIRNSADTANYNLNCDLGTASTTATSSCDYRLKVSTTATAGYTIFAQTSNNGLYNGTNSIVDANPGPAGTNLNATGVEVYGVIILAGNVTEGIATLNPTFDAGSDGVGYNIGSSDVAIITSSGPNSPANTDLVNTSLVTHKLNIATDTFPGDYTQSVIYTVVPTF